MGDVAGVVQAIASKLLMMGSMFTGYPVPPELPRIEVLPELEFNRSVCGKPDCPALASATPEAVLVRGDLLPEWYGTPVAEALILHEMVHYLQYRWHGVSCFDRARLTEMEREAYMAQNLYLVNLGAARGLRARVNLLHDMAPYNRSRVSGEAEGRVCGAARPAAYHGTRTLGETPWRR